MSVGATRGVLIDVSRARPAGDSTRVGGIVLVHSKKERGFLYGVVGS